MPNHDPSDPAFPHGTVQGYRYGCHAGHPCPSTPTCAEQKLADQHLRTRGTLDPNATAYKFHVMQRLDATIAAVGEAQTFTTIGMSASEVQWHRERPGTVMEDAIALRFDRAWSLHVRGVDTTTPDYPHGEARGYRRSCRCRPCREAITRQCAKERAGIKTEQVLLTDPALVERLGRHAERIMAAAPSFRAAERAVGVSRSSLRLAAARKPIRLESAKRILATSPTTARGALKPNSLTDPKQSEWHVRTMWALGYPFTWQAEQLGRSKQEVQRIGTRPLRRALADQIAALAGRVGDTPAEDNGVDELSVSRARRAAARAGWYPPAFYDDNGRLDARSIPGHPWARLDERAATRLHVGHLLTATDLSQNAIAREVNLSSQTVLRISKTLGVKYVQGEGTRDRKASAAAVHRFTETYDAYLDGRIGPVTAALTLDLIAPGQQNHPEVVAWHAEQEQGDAA